jgi:hypothetical protein
MVLETHVHFTSCLKTFVCLYVLARKLVERSFKGDSQPICFLKETLRQGDAYLA